MPTQGFTVKVDGTEADIERVEIQGSAVTLDLEMDDYVDFGEMVTVAYDPPAAGVIQDALGNQVGAISESALTVANPIPDPTETDPPVASSATVTNDGTAVRISFDEDLFFSTFLPGLPVMLRLATATDSSLTLSWIAPVAEDGVSGEATYYEYRYRKGSTGSFSNWIRTTALQAEVTGLDEDSAYQFQVRSGNVAGPTAHVGLTVRTAESIPTIPAPVVSRLSTQIIISWNTPDLVTAGIATDGMKIEIFRNSSWQVLSATGGVYYSTHFFLTFIVLQFRDNAIPNTGGFVIRVTFLDNSDAAVSRAREITIPA